MTKNQKMNIIYYLKYNISQLLYMYEYGLDRINDFYFARIKVHLESVERCNSVMKKTSFFHFHPFIRIFTGFKCQSRTNEKI